MVQLLWNTSSTLKYQINTTDLKSPVNLFIFLLDARSSCGLCYHSLLVYINLPFFRYFNKQNTTKRNFYAIPKGRQLNKTKMFRAFFLIHHQNVNNDSELYHCPIVAVCTILKSTDGPPNPNMNINNGETLGNVKVWNHSHLSEINFFFHKIISCTLIIVIIVHGIISF